MSAHDISNIRKKRMPRAVDEIDRFAAFVFSEFLNEER